MLRWWEALAFILGAVVATGLCIWLLKTLVAVLN